MGGNEGARERERVEGLREVGAGWRKGGAEEGREGGRGKRGEGVWRQGRRDRDGRSDGGEGGRTCGRREAGMEGMEGTLRLCWFLVVLGSGGLGSGGRTQKCVPSTQNNSVAVSIQDS